MNCLLRAAAVLLNEPVKTLIEEIGHEGDSVAWPQYKKPLCYVGVHMQEIMDCCLRRGYGLVPIHHYPCTSGPNGELEFPFSEPEAEARLLIHITGHTGIAVGVTGSGIRHAWFWNGETLNDPATKMLYHLNECMIREVYLLSKLHLLEQIKS